MADHDIALMAHLMRRAGFGAGRAELEKLVARGYEAVVEELLAPGDPGNMPDDVIRRYHVDMHELRYVFTAGAYWLYRMVTTRRPLEEKIALFWHGILATGYAKTNQARNLLDQVDMFRRYGGGRFDALLIELSKDPAMIIWLDNNENHNGAINENYGRELLELFSMGIGNYTEQDVKEAARAFTGWTLGNAEYMAARAAKDSIWPYGRIAWHFEFREHDHDDEEKTFLGEKGRFNGEEIVEVICRQEATARFVARHLYDFFVADEAPVPQWPYTPPADPEAISVLVNAYFESDHNIGSMLRVMFNSDFFKEARFKHVKCPAELVVGTMRLSGSLTRPTLDMLNTSALVGYMGQSLLNPPSVEGWHEGAEWINSGTLLDRVNFASEQLSDVESPGVSYIIDRLAAQDGGVFTPEQFVDSCLDLIGPIAVSDKTRAALIEQVARKGDASLKGHQSGDASERRVGDLLSLIASTREYQLA
jgi:uncharacterized protein (DUF1800 family)